MIAKQPSREVDVIDIPGQLRLIRIFDTSLKKEPIGFALVSMDKDKLAVLWYINILKEFRKQKFASDIILAMQSSFDRIESLWESEEGRELCIKNGFEVKITSYSKDKVLPVLVWTKKG